MTSESMLVTGVSTLAGVVSVLFGILMAWNRRQEKRLVACDEHRAELQNKIYELQEQLAKVWESLYKAGVTKVL